MAIFVTRSSLKTWGCQRYGRKKGDRIELAVEGNDEGQGSILARRDRTGI